MFGNEKPRLCSMFIFTKNEILSQNISEGHCDRL